MSYKIKIIEKNGKVTISNKIANDNPDSQFGFDDKKIEKKCIKLLKIWKKSFPDVEMEIIVD